MAGGFIREYEAGTAGLQTSQAGINAFEDVARLQRANWGEVGREIGRGIGKIEEKIELRQTQKEMNEGAAAFAALWSNKNQAWNDLEKATDPNDATIAPKFLNDDLEPSLEGFVSSFKTEKGRQWAQNQVDNLRQHFFEKTTADLATRARSAVNANLMETGNITSNLVMQDPSSLDAAIGFIKSSVQQQIEDAGALTGTDAGELASTITQQSVENVVQAAFIGMAQKNPQAFLDDLASGALDKYTGGIDAKTIKTISDYATSQLKAQEADAKAAVVAQEKADKAAVDKAVVDLLRDTLQPDGTLMVPVDAKKRLMDNIAPMPGAVPADITTTSNFLDAVREDAAKGVKATTTPEIYQDFSRRSFLSPGDPNVLTQREILKARTDRLLSDADATLFLKNISEDVQDPEKVADNNYFKAFLEGYKSSITKSSMMTPDGAGDQRYYQFTRDMLARFNAGKANGRSSSELLTPTSQYFILGPNARELAKYQLTLAEATANMQEGAQTVTPTLAPVVSSQAAPSESLDTFLTGLYGGTSAEQLGFVQAGDGTLVPKTPLYKPGMTMDELAKLLGK